MRQVMNMVQQEEEEATIDLTPMLDVVFIMLIFFIVTASFVKESGIEVNRPDAPTAVKQEKANILVAISARNEIYIDRRRCRTRAPGPRGSPGTSWRPRRNAPASRR